MKLLKNLSLPVITGLSLMVGQAIFPLPIKASDLAPECPDDFSTYANLAAFEEAGNCRGTPETYGVKVYKMGFCVTELASGGAGTTPDYSTCEVVYNSATGEDAEFGVDREFNLSAADSTLPAPGSYNYAFILFHKNFKIQSKLGPFADGETWYTDGTAPASDGSSGNMSTTETDYAISTVPMNSFDGGDTCDSDWSGTVGGSTLNAYLIDEDDGSIIPSTGEAGVCSGHDKVLGVAGTSFTVTSSTTAMTTTFDVSKNGTTFWVGGDGTPAGDSGPFSVTFTIE